MVQVIKLQFFLSTFFGKFVLSVKNLSFFQDRSLVFFISLKLDTGSFLESTIRIGIKLDIREGFSMSLKFNKFNSFIKELNSGIFKYTQDGLGLTRNEHNFSAKFAQFSHKYFFQRTFAHFLGMKPNKFCAFFFAFVCVKPKTDQN